MDESSLKFQAKWDFEKAKNKAVFREIVSRLFNKDNELFQFDEVKYLLSPKGMVYRGIKTIPINMIVGSEGRYQDFDKGFLPMRDHTRPRWMNIDVLKKNYVELPPIEVYKISEYYFIKDGNHRVSVAREMGQEFIDAEVIELFTRVKLNEKNIDTKTLLIAESQNFFLEKTNIDKLIPGVDIKLTHPWGYYRLLEHITTYKYYLGEKLARDVSWEESVKGWYYDLYLPVYDIIIRGQILKRFMNRTAADLYIWTMDHWHYLKENYGKDIDVSHAIHDYSARFGENILVRFFKRLNEWFIHMLIGQKK